MSQSSPLATTPWELPRKSEETRKKLKEKGTDKESARERSERNKPSEKWYLKES